MALKVLQRLVGMSREDVKYPVPVPEGHYFFRIAGLPGEKEKEGKDGPYYTVSWPLTFESPGEGVDLNALQLAGGLTRPDGVAKGINFNVDVYNDDQDWKIKAVVDGVLGKGQWSNFDAAFQSMVGQRVSAEVEHYAPGAPAVAQPTTQA